MTIVCHVNMPIFLKKKAELDMNSPSPFPAVRCQPLPIQRLLDRLQSRILDELSLIFIPMSHFKIVVHTTSLARL